MKPQRRRSLTAVVLAACIATAGHAFQEIRLLQFSEDDASDVLRIWLPVIGE